MMMIAAPALRSEYPFAIRDTIERLWRMAFGPVFPAPFSKTFSTVSVEAEVSWWLSGVLTPTGCLAAYTPKGAASQATSYDNNAAPGNGLADGTYDLYLGTAPTWDSTNGLKFLRTSSQFLKTGLLPLKTYSMIARFSNQGSNLGCLCGERNTSGIRYFLLAPYYNATNCWFHCYSWAYLGASPATSGVWCLASNSAYIDGSPVSGSGAMGDDTPLELYVGGCNIAGAYMFGSTAYLQALAIYDYKLSQAEVTALTTAMNAL